MSNDLEVVRHFIGAHGEYEFSARKKRYRLIIFTQCALIVFRHIQRNFLPKAKNQVFAANGVLTKAQKTLQKNINIYNANEILGIHCINSN